MAEEWREHYWRDLRFLHHASHNDRRQWLHFLSDGHELCRKCDQQQCDCERKCSSSRSIDYDSACEPDRNRGTDGHLHGQCNGYRTDELSVEEERREYCRCDLQFILHAGYKHDR